MLLKRIAKYSRFPKISLKNTFSTSSPKQLPHLKPSDFLVHRHVGPNNEETVQMLKIMKVDSVDQLIRQSIPSNIRDSQSLNLGLIGDPVSQTEYVQRMRQTFKKNKTYKTYLGLGFYPTILPAVIQRSLLQNPGWYTAYTPYQAEIAQGRLQSLINYQTMVQQLTKMDFSNASLLDQASAGGEGFFMAMNANDKKRNKFFIDQNVFMPTRAVIKTKAKFLDVDIVIGKYQDFVTEKYNSKQFCGIIVQSPDAKGVLHDFSNFFKTLQQKDDAILKIVGSDLLALTISKAPGVMGADVCYGSSQRLGVPMGFGGPYSGFFAVKQKLIRKMPGRIIGISKDSQGNMAYRMALQTRQQHIRRQKATSNICTAQALLANISSMYAIYHGPKGLKNISQRINSLAQITRRVFQHYGFKLLAPSNSKIDIFDTVTVANCQAAKLTQAFLNQKINIRFNSQSQVSLSFSQVDQISDLQQISQILSKFTGKSFRSINDFDLTRKPFQVSIHRGEDYMKQKIFNSIHSQSQMLRYLKHLQLKDISLTKSMIPLGSCTMKLNSASEMTPLTWAELNIHPFVPRNQVGGYIQIIQELRGWLKQITKFDQISFQPNSGATGEYAGLLTINQYLRSTGQGHRKVCLIPRSAHGTNPASAILAGMNVVPVEVNEGKVDIYDFRIKVEKHKHNLGAFMVTFPSTAGRYEETILQMTDMIHHYGGQVYMDGANMNAQVGFTSPGFIGADVCHLNLHKTFAIPHGGGGPGMGPIGVRKHLSPFLPSHPFLNTTYDFDISNTISNSQFGSASILTISHAYIALLGRRGIIKSTEYAILNANYLMSRLRPYYKILYLEDQDRCAHEFIIDVEPFKKRTGVSQEDIAKRLMDFGFHAPTMSFPTAGTLMIQPTESQDKGQLDRFAEAMIKIHHQAIQNPQIVKNAPYTAQYLMKANWPHKFTRQQAAYPLPWVRKRGKYWPPVGRISNPYGDKNLICACPSVSDYVQ